jgi:cytidylate kinase
MSERLLIPSIEQRLTGLVEVTRRNLSGYSVSPEVSTPPAITISREFGCEAYLVAERLKELLDAKTKATWTIMDKALLEVVARNHQLSTEMLQRLGEKNRFLDDMLSTFSPRWKSDKDHYRLLCKQITALAEQGNVILVGRGGAILTQQMTNCFHFRLIATSTYKVRSIMRRAGLTAEEAESLIRRRQHQRDDFVKDFLGRNVADPTLYHLIFNNAKNGPEQIAATIVAYLSLAPK